MLDNFSAEDGDDAVELEASGRVSARVDPIQMDANKMMTAIEWIRID
jgi:hypothetical protein